MPIAHDHWNPPCASEGARRGETMRRAGGGGNRILIVDDDADVAEILGLVLARGGYRHIASTTDAHAVIPLACAFRPDLIVLDLMMPGIDGLSLLTELRASEGAGPALPILMVSGDHTSETRSEVLRSGASGFLAKPYLIAEMLACVGGLLGICDGAERAPDNARAPVAFASEKPEDEYTGLIPQRAARSQPTVP